MSYKFGLESIERFEVEVKSYVLMARSQRWVSFWKYEGFGILMQQTFT